MTIDARQRALDKVIRLSGQGLNVVDLWKQTGQILGDVVPHYGGACWYTLDPASLLITSHFNPSMPELPHDALVHEYYEDDVNKLVDVARSDRGIQTLHEVTNGDPSGTPRWQKNIAMGGDQEMIAGLRTKAGDVWGALGLYRTPGDPMFDDADLAFVTEVAPYLAEAARRSLLVGEASEPHGPDAPGLLVLTEDWEVESTTPGVDQWLSELPGGDWDAGTLPPAVVAVAARALRTAEHPHDPGEIAVARVLSRTGTWVVLHGAPLASARGRRVAVIVEPAHPARISSLLMSAYGMTGREKDVTRLVLQGFSTSEIADHLVVSPHTVQQHLKSIFEKTGVRSRRDLTGKVFFAHYEPRFRDNERRALDGKPLLGSPVATDPA